MHLFFLPLTHFTDERHFVFYLGSDYQVIGCLDVTSSMDSPFCCDTSEVFKGAALAGATAIICARNTLSLSVAPSSHELKAARKLIRAGEKIGIEVHDLVIVNRESLHSMCECSPKLWS
jgi:DNA repair protein RadC